MNINIINTEYSDSSVLTGLKELSKVDADKKFAKNVCNLFNAVYDADSCSRAPCRDLIEYSDDTITSFINAYSDYLNLLPPKLDITSDPMVPVIQYIPSHYVLKYIRTYASTF